jgi:hypothetical protein
MAASGAYGIRTGNEVKKMMDLDRTLQRLSATPVPVDIDNLDERVFARLHALAERDRRTPPRLALVAAIGAAAMGVAATPAATATAASLAPLGASSPLAPSTLLLGDR